VTIPASRKKSDTTVRYLYLTASPIVPIVTSGVRNQRREKIGRPALAGVQNWRSSSKDMSAASVGAALVNKSIIWPAAICWRQGPEPISKPNSSTRDVVVLRSSEGISLGMGIGFLRVDASVKEGGSSGYFVARFQLRNFG